MAALKESITKNALLSSFEKLLKQKPFENITIKDIVEDCGVSRNTFYYYFDDIFAVATFMIEKRVNKGLRQLKENKAKGLELLISMTENLNTQRKMVEHLFKTPNHKALMDYLKKSGEYILEKHIYQQLRGRKISDGDLYLIRDFYLNAAFGLVLNWFDQQESDVEANIKRLQILFEGEMDRAIERAVEKFE